jgi:hypothetical protein
MAAPQVGTETRNHFTGYGISNAKSYIDHPVSLVDTALLVKQLAQEMVELRPKILRPTLRYIARC